jgi:hypothetical protein
MRGKIWLFLRRSSALRKVYAVRVFAIPLRIASYLLVSSSGHKRIRAKTSGFSPISDIIEVKSISLDDYIFEQKGRPPSFIKIDVEGGESAVLSGALGALNKFKPRLLCEIHSPSVAGPLKDLLARFGYSLKDLPSVGKSYVWAVSSI